MTSAAARERPKTTVRVVPQPTAPLGSGGHEPAPLPKPISKVQRTVEILSTLYANDFFGMMRELASAERKRGPRGGSHVVIPDEMPVKVRRILEELGPTFVKIGQLLGTRPDLLPKAFVDEFKNLYDKTTPSPFPKIKALIEAELGRPMHEVFTEFSETPVASASIGQVHFAILRTGESVAVKVQHPEIEERVWVDFEIMEPMVRFIENFFAASRVWQPREHLMEVYEMLIRELDYRYEARNHQRVFDNFKGDPSVKIPKIYWEYSAKRVLCLERINGIKLSDFSNPDLLALNGRKVANIITRAMAKQIFEDRIFHADPSPGNLMAISSDCVAFMDFGAVGHVTRRRGDRIMQLIFGFVRSDLESVSQALLEICNVYGEVDLKAFQRDVERIMDYHEREHASIGDPVVLDMIINVSQRHNMLLPPDFFLITRALFQFEGLNRKLDPEFELVEVLEPYVMELLRKEALSPARQKEAVVDMAFETAEFMRQLPARLNSIARKLDQNEIRFKVDVASLSEFQNKEERRSMRSTFTMLVAALIIGTGLVMTLGGGTTALFPFFFASALILLLWSFVMLYMSD